MPRLDGPFDLVFLDAIKSEYEEYLAESLPLLTAGGMVVAGNLLRSGRVAAAAADTETDVIEGSTARRRPRFERSTRRSSITTTSRRSSRPRATGPALPSKPLDVLPAPKREESSMG
ncbi:O-methyltransferase [Haloterrigena turkmenica]|uniref:O-methyltransferase n=1 Tax=Haloterrigena turkmenica TaxID=62320 RepID=UPI000B045D66|nr:hypothetical protein [Haloterrigena turkmenica]